MTLQTCLSVWSEPDVQDAIMEFSMDNGIWMRLALLDVRTIDNYLGNALHLIDLGSGSFLLVLGGIETTGADLLSLNNKYDTL